MSATVRMHLVLVLALGLLIASAWSLHKTLFDAWGLRSTELSPRGTYVVVDDLSDGDGCSLSHVGSGRRLFRWKAGIGMAVPEFSWDERVLCWRDAGCFWRADVTPTGISGVQQVAVGAVNAYRPRISADGSRIALPCAGGLLIVCDGRTGAVLWRAGRHGSDFDDAAFSPDGAVVVAIRGNHAEQRSMIDVFDASDGRDLGWIDPGQYRISHLFLFRPGTRELWTDLETRASATSTGPPYLAWDLSDASAPTPMASINISLWGGAFSPSGSLLAGFVPNTPDNQRTIYRVDRDGPRASGTVTFTSGEYGADTAFTNDEKSLLIAHTNGRIESADVVTGRVTSGATNFGEPPMRWWWYPLLGGAGLTLLAWLAVAAPWTAEWAGRTPEGFGSTLIALCIVAATGVFAHLYALSMRSESTSDPINAAAMGSLALAVGGGVMLTVGIVKRRWRVVIFAIAGFMAPAAIYAKLLFETIASV